MLYEKKDNTNEPIRSLFRVMSRPPRPTNHVVFDCLLLGTSHGFAGTARRHACSRPTVATVQGSVNVGQGNVRFKGAFSHSGTGNVVTMNSGGQMNFDNGACPGVQGRLQKEMMGCTRNIVRMQGVCVCAGEWVTAVKLGRSFTLRV